MRLVGRLAIDPDRAGSDQGGAVAALAHEAGAPQPLVEALPVAIFLVRNDGGPSMTSLAQSAGEMGGDAAPSSSSTASAPPGRRRDRGWPPPASRWRCGGACAAG